MQKCGGKEILTLGGSQEAMAISKSVTIVRNAFEHLAEFISLMKNYMPVLRFQVRLNIMTHRNDTRPERISRFPSLRFSNPNPRLSVRSVDRG
jgi:hypothetical protein